MSNFKTDLRVNKNNLNMALRLLREAGYEPVVVAPRFVDPGCGCCDWVAPVNKAGVQVNCSGREAHRVFVRGGMVKCTERGHGH